MKTILSLITLLALTLSADAAFYQFNRWTTNLDTTLINGVNQTNIPGSALQSPLAISTLNAAFFNVIGTVSNSFQVNGTNGAMILGVNPTNNTVTISGGGTSNYLGGVTVINQLAAPMGTNYTSYAAGTAYTLTTTMATLAFATTTPTVVMAETGTYDIRAVVNVKYNAATYVAAQNVQFQLVVTNGGGTSAIQNKVRTVELPVLTTFTGGDTMTLIEVIYNATAGDGVVIQGVLSAAPSAGSITAQDAEIIAVKLH